MDQPKGILKSRARMAELEMVSIMVSLMSIMVSIMSIMVSINGLEKNLNHT